MSNWFFKIIQNKKLLLIIGISLVAIIGASTYIFKDSILNILSSQKTFLAAVFSEKSSSSTVTVANNTSVTRPVKDCIFDSSQIPTHTVIFNEIAWMGNKESANNEWIELKNISLENIEIVNWQLINESQKIKVVFNSTAKMPTGGFYFLERGGANFLTDIKTDMFFTGALKNTGDNLRLFDQDCNLVDQVGAFTAWPAGDNKTKKTMERDSKTLAWHTSLLPEGTPQKENSVIAVPLPVAKIPAPMPATLPETLVKNGNLLISEIMAGDNANVFVEFYNPSDIAVDLTDWHVNKKSSTGSESSLIVSNRLKGKMVLPGKYFLAANAKGYTGAVVPDVTWPGSYILAANNNGVVLYNSLGQKVDQVSWILIPKGESYQRDSWMSNDFSLQNNPNPKNSQ